MFKVLILAALVASISAATLCGPFCMIYCPYGNVLDKNNCPTCRCNEAPLSALQKSEDGCAPVLCKMYCVNGWQKNEQGCDFCACAGHPL